MGEVPAKLNPAEVPQWQKSDRPGDKKNHADARRDG
jgi:hypothetical protein